MTTTSDTPRTDKARLDILQTGRPARVKASFAEELERENDELHIAVNVARQLIKTLQDDNIKLRAALERLRDCDFVVTPMDRMDAVRDIAREALKGVKP
jgi:cell division protein FtsB